MSRETFDRIDRDLRIIKWMLVANIVLMLLINYLVMQLHQQLAAMATQLAAIAAKVGVP